MPNILKMKNKNHIIYKVTKVTNRKVYIGATTKSIRERQLDHLERAARGQVGKLYEAIRTLGPEAFKMANHRYSRVYK